MQARVAVLCLVIGACGSSRSNEQASATHGGPASNPACEPRLEAPSPLPGVKAEHLTEGYWLRALARTVDVDEVLMTPEEIDRHNLALETPVEDRPLAHEDLARPPDEDSLRRETTERLTYLQERVRSGAYLSEERQRIRDQDFALPGDSLIATPSLRVALAPIALRCGPRNEPMFDEAHDVRFDRNACSTIEAQEVIQVLRRWQNGMWFVRNATTIGWVAGDAPFSPAVPRDRERDVVHGARLTTRRTMDLQASLDTVNLPAFTPLAQTRDGHVLLATSRGFEESAVASRDVWSSRRPFTRRALLEAAFSLLGTPYGWGGQNGGRDCSAFLLDLFGSFGFELPRHSARQALAGTFSIDISEVTSSVEKERLIHLASARGAVLLQFPGHIMLYLGRDDTGTPMVLHAFAEYLEPCPGGHGETLRTVDTITVSNLKLGEGTSRRSFLERLTRITVLGKTPDAVLLGAATLRNPAQVRTIPPECTDTLSRSLFRSPRAPNSRQPLRVIAVLSEHPGPAELVLFDPSGAVERPSMHALGGPPFGTWVEVPNPQPGAWTAVLADGSHVTACEQFRVQDGRPTPEPSAALAVWEPRWKWEEDTENLYALFVEELFNYPLNDELSWPNLQALLQESSHNLFFNHLSLDEDQSIRLEPDCADLPYFLRTYFAWKARLPVAFRRCSRGRAGQPPSCGGINSNVTEPKAQGDVAAFSGFMRDVANGVHSATGRTAPSDSETDLYPVPFTRSALRPGTVYADPYGHLLVIAQWLPQRANEYGILLGADAQPDGTIGRRRFWRGSFLFTPETTDVGAGFKAWRPIEYDAVTKTLRSFTNDELAGTREHTPFSMEAYQGTSDDFYDRMEALIHPRPLEPSAVLLTLVDALEESVVRRVQSIDNEEAYVREHPRTTISMPTGYEIFETTGAWEDYATPSRDMRLLISIDAVQGFADAVRRRPQRFALSPSAVEPTVRSLDASLAAELARRTFEYTRSDAGRQSMRLADVVERAAALEVAYNPNDCAEIRWGAAEGSAEAASCSRRAPADQRRRMEEYRPWFHTRRRPPR